MYSLVLVLVFLFVLVAVEASCAFAVYAKPHSVEGWHRVGCARLIQSRGAISVPWDYCPGAAPIINEDTHGVWCCCEVRARCSEL